MSKEIFVTISYRCYKNKRNGQYLSPFRVSVILKGILNYKLYKLRKSFCKTEGLSDGNCYVNCYNWIEAYNIKIAIQVKK